MNESHFQLITFCEMDVNAEHVNSSDSLSHWELFSLFVCKMACDGIRITSGSEELGKLPSHKFSLKYLINPYAINNISQWILID